MKNARIFWVCIARRLGIDRKVGLSRSSRQVTIALCFAALHFAAAPSAAQEALDLTRVESAAPAKPESLADVPETEWTDAPEPEKPVVREGLILLPSLGLAFTGSGTLEASLDCQADACTSASFERDYSQNPNALLGFDTLYHVLPSLRLGLGLQWIPTSDVDVENGDSSTEFGDELSTTAVVEGVFGGKSAGALRGFIGTTFLFPGGELQELIDAMDAACRSTGGAGGSCNVADGPYVGLTLGAAAAFLRQVSRGAALRVELALQYVSFSGPNLEVTDEAGRRYEDSLSWSGTRLSLRFGIEF
ncbi:MAG TPA: hypothetical protein VI197_03105 [Polyangiaceae bacterium]